MKILSKALIGIIVSVSSSNVFAQTFDWTESNINVANQHIVPKYQVLAAASDHMHDQLDTLCGDALKQVSISSAIKDSYRELFIAWAEVQYIQFGPVSFLKRYERFHYWPDKHNVGSRQLQRLLSEIEKGTIQASTLTLASKSVSVQGLSALERLLFSQAQVLDASECILSQQIAANLQDIAHQVDSSWRLAPVEFAKEFELAGREQGTYGSSLDVSTMLANTLATQLLMIAEYKLGRALPKEQNGRVYQRQLEAWLSQLSLVIIEHSLLSLQEFYIAAFAARTEQLNADLHNRILSQFANIFKHAGDFDQPLIEAIVDEQERPKIVALQNEVMALETIIRSEMFTTLGFATRFNSLDGD